MFDLHVFVIFCVTAAAYANNASSTRGTPPTIGFSPSVYPQGATHYGYGARKLTAKYENYEKDTIKNMPSDLEA